MNTFIEVSKRAKWFSNKRLGNIAMTHYILDYKIKGDVDMYYHLMYLHN